MVRLQDIPNDIKVVYFIKSGEYLKIGIASQLRTRYKAINTDCPLGATLIGWIPYSNHRELEHTLHKKYKEYAYRGEWFTHSDEIMAEIEQRKSFVSLEGLREHNRKLDEVEYAWKYVSKRAGRSLKWKDYEPDVDKAIELGNEWYEQYEILEYECLEELEEDALLDEEACKWIDMLEADETVEMPEYIFHYLTDYEFS